MTMLTDLSREMLARRVTQVWLASGFRTTMKGSKSASMGAADSSSVSPFRQICQGCGRPMRREANCVVCDSCGESKCG